MSMTVDRPPLRYFGSKFRIAPWVIEHFPPHRIYVEPFGGGGSVLLRKQRSKIEVYNDLNGEVVNFFRVLQSTRMAADLIRRLTVTPYARKEFELAAAPARSRVERARRFAVRGQMGFGANNGSNKKSTGFRSADWGARRANNLAWPKYPETLLSVIQRFAGVVIENRPADQIMTVQDSTETLFYLDPPYLHSTRSSPDRDRYVHDMNVADHDTLLKQCRELKGYVVISGYDSPIYHKALEGWTVVSRNATTCGNALAIRRMELMWLSPRTADALEFQLVKS